MALPAGIKSVEELAVEGKRVFVRVDFNVPLEDGKVTDDTRIRAALPTIRYLLGHSARVILASHLGRPDGKVQDGLRLRPVAERLSQLLGRTIPVTGDALGIGTVDAVKRLRNGEALLLENLRFHAEEEKNDPKFAQQLADYAEVYVNDAFGTAHRAHASTVGIAEILPPYAGFLMEREIQMLSRLLESPEHPFAAIVGGATKAELEQKKALEEQIATLQKADEADRAKGAFESLTAAFRDGTLTEAQYTERAAALNSITHLYSAEALTAATRQETLMKSFADPRSDAWQSQLIINKDALDGVVESTDKATEATKNLKGAQGEAAKAPPPARGEAKAEGIELGGKKSSASI